MRFLQPCGSNKIHRLTLQRQISKKMKGELAGEIFCRLGGSDFCSVLGGFWEVRVFGPSCRKSNFPKQNLRHRKTWTDNWKAPPSVVFGGGRGGWLVLDFLIIWFVLCLLFEGLRVRLRVTSLGPKPSLCFLFYYCVFWFCFCFFVLFEGPPHLTLKPSLFLWLFLGKFLLSV